MALCLICQTLLSSRSLLNIFSVMALSFTMVQDAQSRSVPRNFFLLVINYFELWLKGEIYQVASSLSVWRLLHHTPKIKWDQRAAHKKILAFLHYLVTSLAWDLPLNGNSSSLESPLKMVLHALPPILPVNSWKLFWTSLNVDLVDKTQSLEIDGKNQILIWSVFDHTFPGITKEELETALMI